MEDIMELMKAYSLKITESNTVEELMGIEGMIRQTYYDAFNLILERL